MHWVIPRLANRDVSVIIHSLRAIIDTSFSNPQAWRYSLDTPSHFFVANKIARQYPHLIESGIVLSFHSYFPPGRMTNHFTSSRLFNGVSTGDGQGGGFWSSVGLLLRRFTMAGIVIGLLQFVGTFPMATQEFFMSLVLPVVFAGIITGGSFLVQHPVYFVIPAALILYFFVSHLLFLRRHKMRIAGSETKIVNQVDGNVDSLHSDGGVGSNFKLIVEGEDVQSFLSENRKESESNIHDGGNKQAISVESGVMTVETKLGGIDEGTPINDGDLLVEELGDDVHSVGRSAIEAGYEDESAVKYKIVEDASSLL